MEKIKGLVHNKKFVMFLFLAVVCVSSTFAEDDFGLDKKIQILLDLFTSPWIKGIACIALIVECIGLVTAGRQEPGMFKKFVPWIAGTIIFMAAGTITNKFIDFKDTTIKTLLS